MRILINQHSNIQYNEINFKAMKKSQFSGINRFVVEKYNLPHQKFNGMQDFFDYCGKLVEQIRIKDFSGRQDETKIHRENLLKEWFEYVTNGNKAYTQSVALMILQAVTHDLKPKDDTLPPVLNKRILADTVEQTQRILTENPKTPLDFAKYYCMNLKKNFLNEEQTLNKDLKGWIIIPSKQHDSRHFKKNVEKLKVLSHQNWCTKSYNAEPYLKEGDFHIYYKDGKPKYAVRFVGDVAEEIETEANDFSLNIEDAKFIKKYLKPYKLSIFAEDELESAQRAKKAAKNFIKEHFPKGVENYSAKEIFEAVGIDCKQGKDRLLTISHYRQPYAHGFSFSDIGVDENDLLKDVKIIKGYTDFADSNATDLGNIIKIDGTASFSNSKFTRLFKLKEIREYAYFNNSKVQSLDGLTTVGGSINFQNSPVTDIGELKTVKGGMCLSNSKIKDLKGVETIGWYLNLEDSIVEKFPNLKKVGGKVCLSGSKLTSDDFKNVNVGEGIYIYRHYK